MKTSASFAMLALAITITGCGGGGGGEGDGDGDGTTTGGEVPAEYVGPVAETADATAGAEMYDQACGGCHPGSGPELDGIAWTAAAVRQQIREGDDEMPPMASSRLSDEDMENVLAHMVTIGSVTE